MRKAILLLTGGTSKRMGKDKAFLTIKNESFLNQWKDCDVRYLSDNILNKHHIEGYDLILDEYNDIGPINGIVSCFHQTDVDTLFVVACDMPYMTKDVMNVLYDCLESYDGIFLKDKDHLYSLGGVYTRKMLPIMEQQIVDKQYSLYQIIRKCNVRIIDVDTMDIDKNTLMNINTIEEYKTFPE